MSASQQYITVRLTRKQAAMLFFAAGGYLGNEDAHLTKRETAIASRAFGLLGEVVFNDPVRKAGKK